MLDVESSQQLWICHLGTVPYLEAVAIQDSIRAQRQADELPDVLLLLEHPPTYTRGRRSDPAELPLGDQEYRERGIDVVDTNRGGKVTYHGPGQLVGYPLARVTDVVAHVRTMEHAIVAALADHGLRARSRASEGADYTGVWVADRKIASIGVHVSRGVTAHGFAVNVTNDLAPFSWVVPCGLEGVRMTSLGAELTSRGPGDEHLMTGLRASVSGHLCRLMGRQGRVVEPLELGLMGVPAWSPVAHPQPEATVAA
jgi:lipoyl(octanoyl) transferase